MSGVAVIAGVGFSLRLHPLAHSVLVFGSLALKAAKAALTTPFISIAHRCVLVLLVKGGFHYCQVKADSSGISTLTWAAVSSPALPVRIAGSLVLNSVITDDDCNSSSEPIFTLASSCRP